ncbi:MAG: hypothetical protein JJT82_02510 [Legionellaceae bacterium]|nr:hypothetical protein [Legionellaceae bacterium]
MEYSLSHTQDLNKRPMAWGHAFSAIYRRLLSTLIFAATLQLSPQVHYSNSLYFLCGPDEDGCSEAMSQHCFCIPYHTVHANTAWCLDMESLSCTPLAQVKHCEPGFQYPSQGHCLAVIFQSTSEPPCRVTSFAYCMENNSYFCEENGQLDRCGKRSSIPVHRRKML